MPKLIRVLFAALVVVVACSLTGPPAPAATARPGVGDDCPEGSDICGNVDPGPGHTPGPRTTPPPAPGPGPGPGPRQPAAGSGVSAPVGPPQHPGLTYEECVAFLQFTEDRSACQPAAPATPTDPGAPAGPALPAPVIDLATIAQAVRNEVPVPLPTPHTSPPEAGFQLTGLQTWFWLDADEWEPTSVRAEIPGVWVEVTATPTTATWEPGDGTPAVTCTGPSRPHPGTAGAATECGHTYLAVGDFTLTVSVEFAVTWEASTGEGGTLDPITLTTQLPINVQQRQVVIDG